MRSLVHKLLLLLLVVHLTIPYPIYAQSIDDQLKKIEDLSAELDRIKQEKNSIQSRILQEESTQKDLSNSISYLNYQIEDTELTIEQNTTEIEKSQTQIDILGVEISKTAEQIKELKNTISELSISSEKRAVDTYKKQKSTNTNVEILDIFLKSNNIAHFIKNVKYLNALRKHDYELSESLSFNKDDLEFQKENLSDKQGQVKDLLEKIKNEQDELENAYKRLEEQKNYKNILLNQSQAKENEYRDKYAKLDEKFKIQLDELNKLQAEIARATVGGTEVKKGWVIGFQGATGHVITYKSGVGWADGDGICEGYHSHFFVMEKNPNTGKWYYVNPHKYIDSGKLRAPFDSYWISQEWMANPDWYPKTGGHAALDLVPTNGCGTAVKAAGDGTVTFGYDYYEPGLNDPKGSYYAIINHGEIDGIEVKTGYWHLKYP